MLKKSPANGLTFNLIKSGEWQVLVDLDPQARKRLAKRHHDLVGALRTLKFAFESLQRGYRFDDEAREPKLQAMQRALQHLEEEIPLLQQLFLVEPD